MQKRGEVGEGRGRRRRRRRRRREEGGGRGRRREEEGGRGGGGGAGREERRKSRGMRIKGNGNGMFEECEDAELTAAASSGRTSNRTQSFRGRRQRENGSCLYCFKIRDREETETEKQ